MNPENNLSCVLYFTFEGKNFIKLVPDINGTIILDDFRFSIGVYNDKQKIINLVINHILEANQGNELADFELRTFRHLKLSVINFESVKDLEKFLSKDVAIIRNEGAKATIYGLPFDSKLFSELETQYIFDIPEIKKIQMMQIAPIVNNDKNNHLLN